MTDVYVRKVFIEHVMVYQPWIPWPRPRPRPPSPRPRPCPASPRPRPWPATLMTAGAAATTGVWATTAGAATAIAPLLWCEEMTPEGPATRALVAKGTPMPWPRPTPRRPLGAAKVVATRPRKTRATYSYG